MTPLPRIVTLLLSAVLIFACTMEQSDPSGSSSGSSSGGGPHDQWQGIWDFDWQVMGGGCPTLFTTDTRFVKVRWVGSGQLMFIYDEDLDGEFEDNVVLTGSPDGTRIEVLGHYIFEGAEYQVHGILENVADDYITGELYRDIVGACTELQIVEAYRTSYEPSTYEGAPPMARVLFLDDAEGMIELVSIRTERLPERALQVNTTTAGRILVDVPAGVLRISAPGHSAQALELREGEVRDVFLSSLVAAR